MGNDSKTFFRDFPFQLSPWLAVEIPDLIEKGVISYKEKTEE